MTRHASGGLRLLAACLLGGSAGWAITATGAGASTLAAAYRTDLFWVGLLSAALAAPYAALQFPAGALVDRLGVRQAAGAGLSLVLLAHLLALLAPVPTLAMGARLASGIGFSVCFVSGAELARDSGLGARGMGIFGGVALAASGASVIGVTLVEPALGWRAAWATSAVVSAVALVVALCVVPSKEVSGASLPLDSAQVVGLKTLVRDGQLFRLASVHAATLGLCLVLSTWATTLLAEVWHFGPTTAAAVGSLVLGLSVISRPLGGQVVSVAPAHDRALWTVTLLACAAATASLASHGPALVAVVAVLALGLFSGLPFAGIVQAGQGRQPLRPAAAVGLMNTLAFGTVVVGTPAVGWAIDHDLGRNALLIVAFLWLVPLLSLPGAPQRS